MSTVRATLFALLAALIALLPGAASAQDRYYCQMLGQVVETCCCDTGVAARAPSAACELRNADCCQRLSSGSRSAAVGAKQALRGPFATAQRSTRVQPVGALALAAADTSHACTELTQAPRALGPPLFVANCALLS